MTDQEFDVLDELYFVQAFNYLMEELDMKEETLRDVLKGLLEKGWLKCFYNMSDEVFKEDLDFDTHYAQYFYLASKAGLLAHNSI